MVHQPPIDMFGMPPMRDYFNYNNVYASDLPDWAESEHYDNCTTGASWLYKFLKK